MISDGTRFLLLSTVLVIVQANDQNRLQRQVHDDGGSMRLEDSIPGIPGQDYPIFHQVPPTIFTCSSQSFAGYYADVEARCQVFHICQFSGRQDSFLCPNGSLFDQRYFVCNWWFNVDCSQSESFYNLNSELFPEARLDQPVAFSSSLGQTSNVVGSPHVPSVIGGGDILPGSSDVYDSGGGAQLTGEPVLEQDEWVQSNIPVEVPSRLQFNENDNKDEVISQGLQGEGDENDVPYFSPSNINRVESWKSIVRDNFPDPSVVLRVPILPKPHGSPPLPTRRPSVITFDETNDGAANRHPVFQQFYGPQQPPRTNIIEENVPTQNNQMHAVVVENHKQPGIVSSNGQSSNEQIANFGENTFESRRRPFLAIPPKFVSVRLPSTSRPPEEDYDDNIPVPPEQTNIPQSIQDDNDDDDDLSDQLLIPASFNHSNKTAFESTRGQHGRELQNGERQSSNLFPVQSINSDSLIDESLSQEQNKDITSASDVSFFTVTVSQSPLDSTLENLYVDENSQEQVVVEDNLQKPFDVDKNTPNLDQSLPYSAADSELKIPNVQSVHFRNQNFLSDERGSSASASSYTPSSLEIFQQGITSKTGHTPDVKEFTPDLRNLDNTRDITQDYFSPLFSPSTLDIDSPTPFSYPDDPDEFPEIDFVDPHGSSIPTDRNRNENVNSASIATVSTVPTLYVDYSSDSVDGSDQFATTVRYNDVNDGIFSTWSPSASSTPFIPSSSTLHPQINEFHPFQFNRMRSRNNQHKFFFLPSPKPILSHNSVGSSGVFPPNSFNSVTEANFQGISSFGNHSTSASDSQTKQTDSREQTNHGFSTSSSIPVTSQIPHREIFGGEKTISDDEFSSLASTQSELTSLHGLNAGFRSNVPQDLNNGGHSLSTTETLVSEHSSTPLSSTKMTENISFPVPVEHSSLASSTLKPRNSITSSETTDATLLQNTNSVYFPNEEGMARMTLPNSGTILINPNDPPPKTLLQDLVSSIVPKSYTISPPSSSGPLEELSVMTSTMDDTKMMKPSNQNRDTNMESSELNPFMAKPVPQAIKFSIRNPIGNHLPFPFPRGYNYTSYMVYELTPVEVSNPPSNLHPHWIRTEQKEPVTKELNGQQVPLPVQSVNSGSEPFGNRLNKRLVNHRQIPQQMLRQPRRNVATENIQNINMNRNINRPPSSRSVRLNLGSEPLMIHLPSDPNGLPRVETANNRYVFPPHP